MTSIGPIGVSLAQRVLIVLEDGLDLAQLRHWAEELQLVDLLERAFN